MMNQLFLEIERMMKGFTQTLTSVKGIGPMYAAGLLSFCGYHEMPFKAKPKRN